VLVGRAWVFARVAGFTVLLPVFGARFPTRLMFAAGFFLGSAAGGEIAHLAGDATACALVSGTCLATVVALAMSRR
jgi:hypothetical protein